jgi:hypothetical protein
MVGPRLWYNNCIESYNNVIKRDTNWVIQKLPDLVTKLYELEQDQTRVLPPLSLPRLWCDPSHLWYGEMTTS